MGKLENAEMLGLRDKETQKLIAVYPFKAMGSDAEIDKAVRDWYYKQSCKAEDELLGLFVDVLTVQEIQSRR